MIQRARTSTSHDDTGDSHVRARDDHGPARIHVPLAHGRSDQAGIPLLRRPFASRACPIAPTTPASPTSRWPIASATGGWPGVSLSSSKKGPR